MGKIVEIRQVEFHGPLAEILDAFLCEKRAFGYKYNSQAAKLARFDRFSIGFSADRNILSKELTEAWCAKKPNENARNHQDRILLINQVIRFIQRQGLEAAEVSLKIPGSNSNNFVPHIFSESELSAIFTESDEQPYCAWSRNKDKIVPLIFRMIYCCGLRVSEAVKLRLDDVDLQNGILKILKSKNGKDRLVPISDSLKKRCEEYRNIVHAKSESDAFFFPAPYTGAYRTDSIYKIFRNVMWRAGISHGGRGKGPRLHDLRHTFAVHCLKRWIESGEDINSCLPLLSAYMGHKGLHETERYLRLTSDLFPHIISKMESCFGNVIPVIERGTL